jgi:pyruvate,water dikinase
MNPWPRWLPALLLLAACAGTEGAEPVVLSLSVQPVDDTQALPFAFVLTDSDGSREGFCDSGNPECSGDGATVPARSGKVEVLVKKRGYHFAGTGFDVPAGADPFVAAPIVLEPLPISDQNDDFAAALEPGDAGLQDFIALSIPFDTELGPSQVVKFYIHDAQTTDPQIYFQNTKRHQLHYDFAKGVLGLPLSAMDFGRQTYYGEDRVGLAGTLVRYPDLEVDVPPSDRRLASPVALTFFPSDGLSPRLVRLAHHLIEERLGFVALAGDANRLVYQPAGESQEADLRAAEDDFAAAGIPWMRREHLYGDVTLQLLNPGVAYGTLRRMTPEELESAIVSFNDILLLTRLPNSLPIVGGTITEESQTPLAHVNVAARTRGTPNMALLHAADDPRIAPLLGKLVRFEVAAGDFLLEETTLDQAMAFWDSQQKDPMVPEYDLDETALRSLDELGFDDAVRVGAKAANVAELSVLLGDNAPHGFAVPFHYYQQFMEETVRSDAACLAAAEDCLEEGRLPPVCLDALALCGDGESAEPLWSYVDRLLEHPRFVAETPLREATLDGLRHIIRHAPTDPGLAAELNARVAEEFGLAPVRLRSSTNAEDLEGFSGAGLYTSLSAWAAGEDAAGERIRRVWASVWNFKAFEERRFWNMDHMAVKMGVLVHQAFPSEEANGVLITQNVVDLTTAGMYVNVQLGEVPVTNPELGAIPEIFSLVPKPLGTVPVSRQRYSSLSPHEPILLEDEIQQLYDAAKSVQAHFAPLYGESIYSLILDLEFKFHGPERHLFIKQARPYCSGL